MKKLRIIINRNLPILFFISVVVTLMWWYKVAHIEEQILKETLTDLEQQVGSELRRHEWHMNTFFHRSEDAVNAIASELDKPDPNYEHLVPDLLDTLALPHTSAIAAHFAQSYNPDELAPHFSKYTFRDESKTLYAPFFTKSGRDETHYPYDYTLTGEGAPNTGWYSEDIDKGSWFGPYFGQANQSYLISYRAPFRWNESTQKNQGNIVADYSLENLREILAGLQLLSSGYGILLTDDGTIISHPVTDYLSKNISEVESLNLSMQTISRLEEGKFSSRRMPSQVEGETSEKLVLVEKFSERKWTLVAVIDKQDALDHYVHHNNIGASSFTHYQVKLHITFTILSVISGFLGICLLLALSSIKLRRTIWLTSGLFSMICVVAILMIWRTHALADRGQAGSDIMATEKTQLAAALNAIERSRKDEPTPSPTPIETGFFVQSVKFISATDVYVTGYAWQKLPKSWKDQLADEENSSSLLGFTLPEAETFSVTEVYSNKAMTRWYFEASLRQAFNYLQYPFDEEQIWLRARSLNFHQPNTILVPDLDAYPEFSKNTKHGLEEYLFIEGWNIDKTAYYFRNIGFSSNFGDDTQNTSFNAQPDLFFGISIKREFVGVLIAHMLPLAVIAYLVFSVLLIQTRNEKKNALMGYNASMVLGYAASLFFALTLSHFSLRQSLQAKGVIYLEYFYFSLYIALAFVVANALTFTLARPCYKGKTQWAPFIYWPALMLSLVIFTIMRFS